MSNYYNVDELTVSINDNFKKVRDLQFKSNSTPDLNNREFHACNKKKLVRDFLKLFKSQTNINDEFKSNKKKNDKKEVFIVRMINI